MIDDLTDKEFIEWLLKFHTPDDFGYGCDNCDFEFDGSSSECLRCMEMFAKAKLIFLTMKKQ